MTNEFDSLTQDVTPLPWTATGNSSAPILGPPRITRKGNGLPKPVKGSEAKVVSLDNTAGCSDPECCADSPYVNLSLADAKLIVRLRNALPEILTLYREAESYVEIGHAIGGEDQNLMNALDALKAKLTGP